MGFTHPHSRLVAHVYYQLFESKMADGDQLWSRPKFKNDLLRWNASTNGRKTDLIERYILHWKPNHTIYVRYFSILLYLLNVQVAPTENKTYDDGSVWMCFRDRIQRQDQENLSYLMLSIIIGKEDFEVNCLYKTIWDSFPGIGYIGEKNHFY